MTAQSCGGHTSAHDGIDPREHFLHDGRWPLPNAVLCRGCVARLRECGYDFRPERRGATRLRVRPRFSLRRAA